MNARRLGGLLLLMLAFAAGSWIGWWMVPAVALLWGALQPAVPRPAATAALAATLSWALWLAADAVAGDGALGRLTDRLSAILTIPAPLLYAATLVLAALLAWSAAAIGGFIGLPGRSSARDSQRALPER